MRNRQVSIQKRIIFSVFAGIACLFFFTCGIPVYYVIEPPVAEHIPTEDSTDTSQRYFSFICPYSASSENSEFTLSGTGIYYRIYDSSEAMESDISSISSRNGEYSENGYLRMIELNYQPLISNPANTPVIKKTSSSRTIRLWLLAEGEGVFPAGIYDYTNNPDTPFSVPVRSGAERSATSNENPGFQFTSNYVPLFGDSDTKFTIVTENTAREDYPNVWYVNLYAVTIGREVNLSPHYSSLLHLGKLKITYND